MSYSRFFGSRLVLLSAVTALLVLSSAFISVASAVDGTQRYVATTGTDAPDCSNVASPCLTIQYAIGQAIAGDTINVAAGTYTENVNVDKSLTLQGVSSATVTVNAANPAISVFTVTANDVDISGFTASGATGGGQAGIYIGNSVTGSNIHNNVLTGSFDGIWLGSGSNHNTLADNTLSSNTAQGFELYHSDYNTLTNNHADSNTGYGFKMESADHNTFTDNTANSNTKYGFYLAAGSTNSDYNTLTGNTASSNTEYGIRMNSGSGNTLTGNTFNLNGAAGIRLKDDITDLTLNENIFSGSPIGIDIATASTDVTSWTMSRNKIIGNTVGVSNLGTGTLNAENNYWGSASPDFNTAVFENVDYNPWYNSDSLTTKTYEVGVGKDYTTIQSAINAASSGDTVNVAAGTYDEQVVVTKSLTLQGAGDTTIVKPSSAAKLTDVYTYPAGFAYYSGVKISGVVEVKSVTGAGVTIENIKVDGSTVTSLPAGSERLAGILYGESAGKIDDVTVDSIKTADYADRTYGIDLSAAVNTVSVEVSNSRITDFARNGIMGNGPKLAVNIHDNTITGPTVAIGPNQVPNGIVFIAELGGSASNNVIHSLHYVNAEDSWRSVGIMGFDTLQSGVLVESNEIYDVDDAINPSSGMIIQGNNLYDNGNGVVLEMEAVDNQITDNTIYNNEHGIQINGALNANPEGQDPPGAGNAAYDNVISGNTAGVVNYDNTADFDATKNYWGVVNPDFGSAVDGFVSYRPWYIDSARTRLNEEVTSCSPDDIETDNYGTDTGVCELGTKARTCSADGSWGEWSITTPAVGPTTEICVDGLDNDCDGYTDASDTDCSISDYYTKTQSNDIFAKSADIADMASKTWVDSLGFITQTFADARYVLSANFNTLFDTQFGTKTTNNLAEGSSNLYFTTGRVIEAVGNWTADKINYYTKTETYSKTEVDTKFSTELAGYYTEAEINNLLTNYYTKTDVYTKIEVDGLITGLSSTYYTETEIDNMFANYYNKNNIDSMFNNYYTKTEINTALAGKSETTHTHVESDITNLDKYTKEEVDDKFATELAAYYTQTQINNILTNYYTKTNVYTKSEVDGLIAGLTDTYYTESEINNIFTNYYTKNNIDSMFTDYYTKSQTDATDANIQSQITTNTGDISSLEDRAAHNENGVDIYLQKGWNKFKMPWFVLTGTAQVNKLDLADYSVATVLGSIDGEYSYLAYYDGTAWQTYVPGTPAATSFTVFPTGASSADHDFHIYVTSEDGARITIPLQEVA